MKHSKTPSILITGATGSVGSQLVRELSEREISFKVLVRSLKQADRFASLPNVEVIYGDLGDKETIKTALKGIDRTFLLTNSSERAETLQLNFVEAAKASGVQHIVKLSQYAAQMDSPVRFLRYHAVVENAIKAAGLNYTFLRPNLYMQGMLAFKDYISNAGQFFASVGNAKISAIDVRDIAAVAVETLLTEQHQNKLYNLTGPEAITHYQMAEHLSNALGKPIQFIAVSPEHMERGLTAAHFPEWQVGGLIEDYAHYARGEAEEVSQAVEEITGKAPRNFKTFAEDYKAHF